MDALNLTNQFLIAMPGLADPNFQKTVTFVCAHSDEGAMGIVINRLSDIALGEVLAQMDLVPADPRLREMPVFHGGPVHHRERSIIIYRPLGQWDSTIQVSKHCGVATSRDILEAMCRGSGPVSALVALGYAGWGAGQLEREMAQKRLAQRPRGRTHPVRHPA